MNLFILDKDPIQAAQYYQDLHVNKIVIEGSQMIAGAYTLEELRHPGCPRTANGTARTHGFRNHPMSKWVRETSSNFMWTLTHLNELSKEWSFRFNKPRHFTQDFFDWCASNQPNIPHGNLTMHPQCFTKSFPQCIVEGDPVAGYRNYYNTAKTQFKFGSKTKYASWTNRSIPSWYNGSYQSLQA